MLHEAFVRPEHFIQGSEKKFKTFFRIRSIYLTLDFQEQDIEIWEYAKTTDFCIITFDLDFIDLSTLKGSPPKIICLRTGNTATDNLIQKIRSEEKAIKTFLNSTEAVFLELK